MAGQPYSFADFDIKGTNGCDPFIIKPLKQNNNEGAGNYYSHTIRIKHCLMRRSRSKWVSVF